MHLTLLTVEKNAAPLYRFLSIHLSRQPSSLLPHCFALFSERLACRVLLEKYGPSLARHAQLKDYTGLIGASCSPTRSQHVKLQRMLQASAESHTQQVNFTSTCLPVARSPGCLAFKFDEAAAACTLKLVHSACGSGR
jgi:hypothetical protein